MMFGIHVQLVDMAREATRGMSDEEKIAFAIEVCHGVTNPLSGPALTVASNQIGQHGHMLCRIAFEEECEMETPPKKHIGTYGFIDINAAKAYAARRMVERRLLRDGQAQVGSDLVGQSVGVGTDTRIASLGKPLDLIFKKLKQVFSPRVELRQERDDG